MKSVTVSTDIGRPREEVFAFLVVMANHQRFCDHFLHDWSYSGEAAGAGAQARVRAGTPGPADWIDIRFAEADAPERLVEETTGAKGRRRGRGTWTLDETASGGTHAVFEVVTVEAPPLERLLAPMGRAWLRRGNARALQRLRELLEA